MLRIVVAEPLARNPDDPDDDRTATVLMRALRDAGHEVVCSGPPQTPEQVVATAVQEDADLVGVVAPEGTDHLARITALLEEHGTGDVLVFGARGDVHRTVAWVGEQQ